MSAVANNPEFAKKVGVPTSVGKEFADTKAYNKGGFMEQGYDDRLAESIGERDGPRSQPMQDRMRESEGMEKRKFAGDRSMDKPMGMKAGGKVRGAGKATKGVRPCRMITMKGS